MRGLRMDKSKPREVRGEPLHLGERRVWFLGAVRDGAVCPLEIQGVPQAPARGIILEPGTVGKGRTLAFSP